MINSLVKSICMLLVIVFAVAYADSVKAEPSQDERRLVYTCEAAKVNMGKVTEAQALINAMRALGDNPRDITDVAYTAHQIGRFSGVIHGLAVGNQLDPIQMAKEQYVDSCM